MFSSDVTCTYPAPLIPPQNTYHTLKDIRIVLADGSVLDTADPASRQVRSRPPLLPLPLHASASAGLGRT